jgi:hypothetical protein
MKTCLNFFKKPYMIYWCLGIKEEGGNRDPIDTHNNIQGIGGSPRTMIHLIGNGCDQNLLPNALAIS